MDLQATIKRMQAACTISQCSEDKYKCEECMDTTWIINENNVCTRCECYEKRIIENAWSRFGVKPEEVAKVNDYKPFDDVTYEVKNKAIKYIQNFDGIKKGKENSFGLFGQPGAGKSHLVIAIGAALLNRQEKFIKVVYMPYEEVIRDLKANAMDDENYIKIQSKYCRAELLIMDDLFKSKVKNNKLIAELNSSDIKHIYPIINYRYLNKLPVLVSSECTPQMLIELDEAIARRILEMCGDNITVFKGIKYNYSLKKFIK
ncbi:DnaA ATPase domain-containing protein [Clostridium grantii]|nr:DnaA/Hda family protein [Clostridium grantii]